MLPAYILGSGRRESVEPAAAAVVSEVPPYQLPGVNNVFRSRLNRFYRGKWEAALQEKWILTVTCSILFVS
jgi:hypothetical protein